MTPLIRTTPRIHTTPRIVVTGRIPQPGLDVLAAAGNVWAWDGEEPIAVDLRNGQLADAEAVVTLLTDRVDGHSSMPLHTSGSLPTLPSVTTTSTSPPVPGAA